MAESVGSVCVVGVGVVSPIGIGADAFTRGLRSGASGVRLLSFEHELMRSSVAATCNGFEPAEVMSEAELARVPRCVPMALSACRQALAMAGLDSLGESASRRTGLILGTGAGGIDFTLDQAHTAYAERKR
ncbi:MAG: beta-ketoacyl synthase N-terminal-like domain-containing protein, partial [Planctomycetota bacterium]